MTLYKAEDCHLCVAALEVIRQAQEEVEFDLAVVDIGGDAVLEKRYRVWLPVVEIDGRREFIYEVDPGALRDRLLGG